MKSSPNVRAAITAALLLSSVDFTYATVVSLEPIANGIPVSTDNTTAADSSLIFGFNAVGFTKLILELRADVVLVNNPPVPIGFNFRISADSVFGSTFRECLPTGICSGFPTSLFELPSSDLLISYSVQLAGPVSPTLYVTATLQPVIYGTRISVSATPLPAASPLFAAGVGIMALIARRRKSAAPAA